VATAERALKVRESIAVAPDDIADTRFALARALWAGGGDRARALMLAKQARAEFATTTQRKDSEREVGDWLRDRAR
jgi:hypothetical protein